MKIDKNESLKTEKRNLLIYDCSGSSLYLQAVTFSGVKELKILESVHAMS